MNLNINRDDNNLNDFLHCWESFGSRPNKIILYDNYITSEFENKILNYTNINSLSELIPNGDDLLINTKSFLKVSEDIYMSFITFDRDNETSKTSEITFFYKSDENVKEIETIIADIDLCLTSSLVVDDDNVVKSNIYSVFYKTNDIDIDNVKFNSNIESSELFYSLRTIKELNKICKNIKGKNKGLSIMYGDIGMGKTSSINYIAKKVEEKKFIYIPNNMIEMTINNPTFINLLKKNRNSVIFMDDFEYNMGEFMYKQNLTINNIIQMVDGYLSDEMSVNIILIFNVEDKEDIDSSLLDSNNLLSCMKFDLLSEKESNDLSEYIGKNIKYRGKNKLINIIKSKKTDRIKKIGF